ncbi:MAG: hypothetical protein IJB67_05305 [Firmicutes bacterium]|nr:hypothetical protein [Bacillota bacterium]
MYCWEIVGQFAIAVTYLAAFWLGAWVREPFVFWPKGKPKSEPAVQDEDKRQRQLAAMLNYGVDDARRAARESRRGV